MKNLLVLIGLLVASGAQASTIDSYSIRLNGQDSTENVVLKATQTKTLYRDEIVDSTCYRTVQRGWELQCQMVPDVICYEVPDYPNYPHHPYPGPGPRPGFPGHRPRSANAEVSNFSGYETRRRVCETRYVQRCQNVPRYVQEAYACKQTIQVPYEVFDYNAENSVATKVTYKTNLVNSYYDCNLDLIQNGGLFSMNTNCANLLIFASKSERNLSVGDVVKTQTNVNAELYDLNTYTAPISKGVKNLRLQGQNVTFTSGDLTLNKNFSIKLYIERRKLLKKDITIINRKLTPAEYTFTKTNDGEGTVTISLTKLFGGINRSKKHIIAVDVELLENANASLKLLNTNLLPKKKVSNSITVND